MKKALVLLSFLFLIVTARTQSLSINTDGSPANASALLDVKSTSKGFLPPRMSTVQRDLISIPAAGLVILTLPPIACNSIMVLDGFHL